MKREEDWLKERKEWSQRVKDLERKVEKGNGE